MNSSPLNAPDNQTLNASCACGDISVALGAKPITMMLCSCKDCQKASGSGHAALALFPADAVSISGKTKSFAVTANSGATTSRHFCPRCATPVFGKSSRFPELVLVPAGLFDNSSWFQPSSLIFARSRLHWDTINPELAQYQTYKET